MDVEKIILEKIFFLRDNVLNDLELFDIMCLQSRTRQKVLMTPRGIPSQTRNK